MQKPAAILTAFLGLQLLAVGIPSTPVFDERTYLPLITGLASGNWIPLTFPHTPIAFELIASGVTLFGDNPLGWRFTSILFGAFALTAFYLLSRKLYPNSNIPPLATATLAFSNLFFTFSGLAVLDIFMLAPALLGFYLLFWKSKKGCLLSGVAFGVALAVKITALPLLLIAFLLLLWWVRTKLFPPIQRGLRQRLLGVDLWFSGVFLAFIFTLILGELVYVHFQFDLAVDPVSRLLVILGAHSEGGLWGSTIQFWELTPTPPWMWLFQPQSYKWFTGTLARMPVLVGVDIPLILPVFVALPFLLLRGRVKFPGAWFLLAWLPWFPLYFLFSRPLYQFYILTAFPALALMNAAYFSQFKHGQWLYLEIVVAYFLLCQYPWMVLIG